MHVPSDRLDARHALVTGGGRGLGRAIALGLAGQGATLTIMARSEVELEATAAEARMTGAQVRVASADVGCEEALVATIAAIAAEDPIDILVCAAGLNRTGPTEQYDIADWDMLQTVNVRGTFIACREVGRAMITRGRGGRIITLSSQMGSVGYPGRAAYCATKHAVNGLTKALAVEWAPHGITVNAIAPTFVETPLTRPMLMDAEFAAEVARRIPDGRLASVEDVAAAAVYLASERARSVTGHVLALDRGWTAW